VVWVGWEGVTRFGGVEERRERDEDGEDGEEMRERRKDRVWGRGENQYEEGRQPQCMRVLESVHYELLNKVLYLQECVRVYIHDTANR